MPDVELLATGEGDYRLHDPDALRAWRRDRKRRDFVDKTTIAAEAVSRLFGDGDYVSFDLSSFTRGPLVPMTVERLAPPSARELEILRDQIDPGRTVIRKTAKSR
jgi:hypothetical protein